MLHPGRPGRPLPGAIEALRSYLEAGFGVHIFTCRANTRKRKEAIRDWLLKHGLRGDEVTRIEINNKKPVAVVYIDDRGYKFRGKYPSVKEIINFR